MHWINIGPFVFTEIATLLEFTDGTKMADRREFSVGGKPISSLRVVDLKVELEKRSLPKSGSKKDLLERLRLVINLTVFRNN